MGFPNAAGPGLAMAGGRSPSVAIAARRRSRATWLLAATTAALVLYLLLFDRLVGSAHGGFDLSGPGALPFTAVLAGLVAFECCWTCWWAARCVPPGSWAPK